MMTTGLQALKRREITLAEAMLICAEVAMKSEEALQLPEILHTCTMTNIKPQGYFTLPLVADGTLYIINNSMDDLDVSPGTYLVG